MMNAVTLSIKIFHRPEQFSVKDGKKWYCSLSVILFAVFCTEIVAQLIFSAATATAVLLRWKLILLK